MANELLGIEGWIYQKLTSDAHLAQLVGARVYSYVIPENANLPAVVYQPNSTSDVNNCAAERLMVEADYVIKVVGATNTNITLGEAANRIDQLLHKAQDETTSVSIFACVRNSLLTYAESDQGNQYRHVGGIYRIQARSK